jgi:hypothetical protein
MRHQTSQPSFKEMSRPKIPVKPQRKTAVCKRINADFIEPQRNYNRNVNWKNERIKNSSELLTVRCYIFRV